MGNQQIFGSSQKLYSRCVISHDLKSLVSSITAAANLISTEIQEGAARTGGNEEIKDYADLICRAGGDMLLLINAIRYSDSDLKAADSLTFREVCKLRNEMMKVLMTFSPVAELKHISMFLNVAEDIPPLYWDIEKLRLHAINNIVSNALRHTPNGGSVSIDVEMMESGKVAIMVADTGDGVAYEDRERVFQKFWHGNNESPDGMLRNGLGLFNAMLVVRAHHGRIRVVDNPRAAGAMFILEIPCAVARIESELTPIHEMASSPA